VNRFNIHGAILLAVLLSGTSHGQEEHQHHHDISEKIGEVDFQISCSAEAQRGFNRAVAWLHSFEYDVAGKAFEEVAVKDPACAMAQWGVAMSLYHALWAPPTRAELQKGAQAVARARSIGAKTDREREYIGAIGAFYDDQDKLNHPTRAAAYERAMEQVSRHYPNDREAAVFYALALNATALAAVPADKTYSRQKKAAGILNRVLREQPQHPGVTHYLIHSYDYPQLAHLALAAARSYARIAPSSAHAQHMPSHIFTRLGLWREDVNANLASEASAKSYAIRNHLAGTWDEQLHAMDYLEYAYLQSARDSEAKQTRDHLLAIRKVEPETFKCAYAFAAIPARYAIERRRWDEAAKLTVQPADFPWQRFRWAEAITYFARSIGAARNGKTVAARQDLDRLTDIHKSLGDGKDNYDWATQVEIQRRAAASWLARAEGNDGEALRLMRSAADLEDSTDKHPVTPGSILPAREMLGDLLMELKQPAEALKEYEASLKDSPNRLNGLYGAARASELAGRLQKAKTYYRKLIANVVPGGAARVEVRHAKIFLLKNRQ
jgi:tetratricopeptide (TPR) repeat protein